jgi:hypothetical protein
VKPKSNGLALIGTLLVLFFVIGVLSTLNGTSSTARSVAPDKPATQAVVNKTLTTLYVTNANDFDWVNPTIHVNGYGGYSYQWDGIVEPGVRLEIGLLNFTKRDGERFQPMKRDVQTVSVVFEGYDGNMYAF